MSVRHAQAGAFMLSLHTPRHKTAAGAVAPQSGARRGRSHAAVGLVAGEERPRGVEGRERGSGLFLPLKGGGVK